MSPHRIAEIANLVALLSRMGGPPAVVLYLAGPMTGLPRWGFDAFLTEAERLRDAGFVVVSPAEHDLDNGFDPDGDGAGFDLAAAMRWDVEAVMDATGLALLPGWEDSQGVGVELTVAGAIGTPAAPVESWIAAAERLAALVV